jgi:hypothetical protein
MNPDAAELFGAPTGVDLCVEELGHRQVIKGDRNDGASLTHELYVFDVEQVVGRSDAESADFGSAAISEVK